MFTRRTEPYRRGVRLGLERGVGGLGHIGGAVHPVRNRRPGIFGYRLDEIPQAGALADGDGEASSGPDHGVGIVSARTVVGPWLRSSAPAPPFHAGSGQRRGRFPALAQAGQQHVAGAGGDGQQRVIAPRTGVAGVLGQSVLADRRISMVNGASPGPPPAFQTRASNSRLTRPVGGAPPEAAQERARVKGALAVKPSTQAVPPARIGVVEQSPLGRRPPGSSSCRRCSGRGAPEELGQARRRAGEDQGIGHQAVVVKVRIRSGLFQHLFGAPCFRACSKTIIDSQEHVRRAGPKAVLRG